ncbi:MAG: hypothetical protein A2Y38_03440 [Spirochaetes bacterium GWB1_59_5]|nr:MAG: hypothetical protein A2Y38_03440 [Spirochaetes bacterium GWB1_59_5]
MAWADLAGLANTATRNAFGESVTIAGQSLTAIYDAAYVEASVQNGVSVSTTSPVVQYKTADFTGTVAQDDAVVAGGITYRVYKVEPDGQGWAMLRLKRAT